MDDWLGDMGAGALAQGALAALALAVWAWAADRRRMRRSVPDAVGWVAWRDVAFWASAAALLLAGAAFRVWVKGL